MHHQRSACDASTSDAASTRPSSGRNVGAAYPRLDQRADQQPGVQHHHERVVPAARSRRPPRSRLQAALRLETTSSASRSSADQGDQDGEGDQAGHRTRPRSRGAAPARSRSRGPSPSARRRYPGRGRPVAQGVLEDVQHRGRRQVADPGQRLPGEPRPRRAAARAPPAMASITLGPPGWQTHQPMSARVRPWSARKLVDVVAAGSARPASGTSASSTIRSPVAVDVEAHGALGVGVEPAAGGEHLDRAGRRRSPRRRRPPRRRRRRTARWRPGWAPRRRRAARSASTARRRPAPRRRPGGRPGSRAAGRSRPRRRRSRARPAASA